MPRCREPMPKCREPMPRCREPMPRCREPMPRCREPMPRCREPMPRCREPMPKCREPMLRCREPMPGCREPMPKCREPMPRCREPMPRCREPMCKCREPMPLWKTHEEWNLPWEKGREGKGEEGSKTRRDAYLPLLIDHSCARRRHLCPIFEHFSSNVTGKCAMHRRCCSWRRRRKTSGPDAGLKPCLIALKKVEFHFLFDIERYPWQRTYRFVEIDLGVWNSDTDT